MELFEKSYYKMTKILLSFLGQWPLQAPYIRVLVRTFLGSFMLSIAIPEVIKLISVLDDLDTVVECIPPLGLHVLNVIKCSTCTFHMDKMLKLMTCMERDWKSRADGDGSDVLKKYAERGRIIAAVYAYYMFVGGGLYVCAPLLPLILDVVQPLNESRPREFLFRTEYYVEQDKHFFPIFLHAFTTTSVSMIVVVAFDTMYSAYVHYACAIFSELSEELEKDATNKDDNLDVSKDHDYVYHRIVKYVRKHKEAIEYAKDIYNILTDVNSVTAVRKLLILICLRVNRFFELMESTYTVCFLCVIGMNIFLISFTGVQTVMRMDDPNLVIRYSIFAFGQMMHAFFLCWHGQLLIDHSEEINIAVYKSNWYVFSFRSRRLIVLMMMRSAKPCQLSARKLFFVSLETFTTVMKTAMSYFTVLRSLQ